MYWPDGKDVDVGLDAFCYHGQRLLGLGKFLVGRKERLIDLVCFPLETGQESMTRLPGHRVRRFYIERQGSEGRIHFINGIPTSIVFSLDTDEDRVVEWIGLRTIEDGERLWIDLAACSPDTFIERGAEQSRLACEAGASR